MFKKNSVQIPGNQLLSNFNLIVLILITAVVSWFFYSAVHSIRFCADYGVHIIMGAHFDFSNSLYYWGQDRLGSIQPMLVWFLSKLFPINYFFVSALLLYLINGLAVFTITKQIENIICQFALILMWFFPPPVFREIQCLAQPYPAQLLMIGLMLLVLNKKKFLSYHTSLLATSLGLAIWISELSIVPGFLLLILYLVRLIKQEQWNKKTLFIHFFSFIIPITLCSLLILYAKSHSVKTEGYNTLLSMDETIAGIKGHINWIIGMFRDRLLLGIIQIVLLLVTAASLLYFFLRKLLTKTRPINYTVIILFLSVVITCILIYSSLWVKLNGFPSRYWVFTFYLFLTGSALVISELKNKILIGLFFIWGIVQTISSIRYATDKNDTVFTDFTYSELQAYKNLGKAGFIGDYWSAYVIGAMDPENYYAISQDYLPIRNAFEVDSVFKQPHLYLIKENFLENFPETFRTHGVYLKKSGEPFAPGRLTLCKYERIKESADYYTPDKLSSRYTDKTTGGKVIINKFNAKLNDFAIFGPFGTLNPGKYKVRIDIMHVNGGGNLVADVSASWGTKLFCKSEFNSDKIPEKGIEMNFELTEVTKDFEFRIYIIGEASYEFSGIELVRSPS